MIRIGANPIGWSNDDMLEIGGDIPLETCLEQAQAAGFTGMELGNKFPRTADKLRPILESYGHSLVSGWYSTELLTRDVDAELEAVKGHATLLRDMGCSVLIAAETSNAIHSNKDLPLSARPVLQKAAWTVFGERYTRFAEGVKQTYGLQLVYHHHMGTVVQTEAEIDRFMEVTGSAVNLLLDTGHATWGGGDPPGWRGTTRRASAMCTARIFARRSCGSRTAKTGLSSIPCWQASILFRATA